MNTVNSLFPSDLRPHERRTVVAMRTRSIVLSDRVYRLKGLPFETVTPAAIVGLIGMKYARCVSAPTGGPVEIILTSEGRDMAKRCKAYEDQRHPAPGPMIEPLRIT